MPEQEKINSCGKASGLCECTGDTQKTAGKQSAFNFFLVLVHHTDGFRLKLTYLEAGTSSKENTECRTAWLKDGSVLALGSRAYCLTAVGLRWLLSKRYPSSAVASVDEKELSGKV